MVLKPKTEQMSISQDEANKLLAQFANSESETIYSEVRDRVFSTLTVGTSIYAPYWFADGTDYSHDEWHQSLPDGHGKFYVRTIDFRIRMSNGLLLTHKKNSKILAFLKHLIAIQIHPRFNGSFYKPSYAQSLLTQSLYVADWLILNAERFNIYKYDLGTINKNDYTYFLSKVSDLPVNESVYQLESMTEIFIKTEIKSINEEAFRESLTHEPRLNYIPPQSVRRLNLTEDEIIRAHYIFWKKDWYRSNRGALVLRTSELLKELYKDTLHGMNQKPARLEELDIGTEYYDTEFPAVEVRRGYTEGISHKVLGAYISTLRKASTFKHEQGFHIDSSAIHSLSVKNILAGRLRKPDGRYVTAPLNVIGNGIRNSLEFIINHADNILEEVLTALTAPTEATQDEKIRIRQIYNPPEHIGAIHLVPKQWSIFRNSPTFYDDLRNATGLCELYQILVGASAYALCSMTARRHSEIVNLSSESCLKPNSNPSNKKNQNVRYSLEFQVAKTGAGEDREVIVRPIPRVIAMMIYKFQQFNNRLAASETSVKNCSLFQAISRIDGKVENITKNGLYDCLDMASDYFQAECIIGEDEVRRRHYIRPHQLRRFFAMVFFNSSSDYKISAVAWMLGHTDLESFYRYVTEVVGGRALNEAKAYALHKAIESSDENSIENLDQLVNKLKDEYNTKSIFIKSAKELNKNLGYLISEESITMEPTFEEYIRGESIEHDLLDYLRRGEVSFEPSFFEVKNLTGESVQKFTLVVKVTDID